MELRPILTGVELQPCCKKSIKEINQKIKHGKTLQAVLIGFPLGQLVIGNQLSSLFSVVSTDWSLLADAVKSVPEISRHAILQIAANEILFRHPGGKLNKFWKAMYDAFI